MKDIISKCLPTYRVGEKLGQGIYGSVYRVYDGLKERAVKIVPLNVERSIDLPGPQALDSKVSMDFLAVQEYYGKIKGNGVVEVYDFHLVNKRVDRDHASADLVILMEYCPDNLNSAVIDNYPMEPSLCISCIYQIAALIRRIGKIPGDFFVISDLKPTNILVTLNGDLVIGDLGGLKRISSLSATVAAQFSPAWTAPEIIVRGDAPGVLSTVYAFGLISYFIWEGRQPYPDVDFLKRISLIRDNGVPFTRQDMPPDLKKLLLKCLAFNPGDRPKNFDEIMSVLSDIKTDFLNKFQSQQNERLSKSIPAPAGKAKTLNSFEAVKETLPFYENERLKNASPGDCWREPITGMELVWVPPGNMDSGDPKISGIQNGFWISRYPVTQGHWKRIMNTNPSHFAKGDDHPVESISWNEAQSFCNKLNARHTERYMFSLPSEIQWEYAARSGGKCDFAFSGSNQPDEVAWHRFNSDLSTHPVGRKKANELGIYDMCGNVLEWCDDFFSQSDFGSSGSKEIYRVSKGGSWKQDTTACRIEHRHKAAAGLGYSDLGFRIVRSR